MVSTWLIFAVIHLVILGFIKSEKSNYWMLGATTFYLFALLNNWWVLMGVVVAGAIFGALFKRIYDLDKIEIMSCTWLIWGLALEGVSMFAFFIIAYSIFNGVLKLSKHFGKEIHGDQHTIQLICIIISFIMSFIIVI